MNQTVDVVIVTYNSGAEVAACVESIPAAHRVIVVDNASTDDTLERARATRAEVIENPANAGFGAGANLGVASGDADLVLLLNPDARLGADTLPTLVAHLAANPTVGVVSPGLRRPDGTSQRAAWPFPSSADAWRQAFGVHRLFGELPDGFVIGACFLVRRAAFEAVDGFDARFWLYGEEADLCFRLVEQGWGIEQVGGVTAEHVGGASAVSAPGLVTEHFHRGHEHFVSKHEGWGRVASLRLAESCGSAIRSVGARSRTKRDWHRDRLRRLAHLLVRSPDTVALDSPATRAPGEGLVVCSLEPWDEVWRRNQFLVRELLVLDPNRRVLFVEPPYDWVHERRNRSGRRRMRGLRPVAEDARIIRFEPGKLLPRVLGPLADRSLRRQVRRAAAKLGLTHPALWVNDPSYAGLPTATGWRSVYDITDDWTKAGGGERAMRRVDANERRLFRECDAVTVCSPALVTSTAARCGSPALIPNAVDREHFVTPQPRPADLPAGPVALYLGTLHRDRLDIDLVVDVARGRPDLTVALVGPNALDQAGLDQLSKFENVQVLGARPYVSVPAYLQHADVIIVPHVVTPFTETLDPIKAYELLVVDTPVVATPVAGFRSLTDHFIVADREDFAAAVDRGIQRERRAKSASVPSWADRASLFQAELDGDGGGATVERAR